MQPKSSDNWVSWLVTEAAIGLTAPSINASEIVVLEYPLLAS